MRSQQWLHGLDMIDVQKIYDVVQLLVPAETCNFFAYLPFQSVQDCHGILERLGMISQVIDGVHLQCWCGRSFLQDICNIRI